MTSPNITTIGLDADDTLWHNERYFRLTQQRMGELLADYADPDHLDARLLETERRNIGHYGYGVKGFTLSMIETALEVTEGKAPGHIISQILEAGREMLSHPIEPLPHALKTLEILSADFQLIVITKGDLFDQERKLAQSGLDHLFDAVEIVSEKTPDSYTKIFKAHGTGVENALVACAKRLRGLDMNGNSARGNWSFMMAGINIKSACVHGGQALKRLGYPINIWVDKVG